MTLKIALEDVMLDAEPLGLAEEFTPVAIPFTTIVGTDEEAVPGEIVYFGAEIAMGDVGEVKGRVAASEQAGDAFAVSIEVLELDSRFPDLLTKTLRGQTEKAPEGENEPLWGIGLKQRNGAMATLVNCPGGLLTAEQMAKLTELASRGHGLVKLTHAQRIILLLRPEQIESVRDELASVGLRIGVLHTGVRNIRGCCGALCQFSQGLDGLGLSLEIDKALYGRPMKFDVKIAVSDCPRNCMESYCVDIGLVARGDSYAVHVGGVASSAHMKGLKLTDGVKPDEAVAFISRILDWYDVQAMKGERLYKTLDRVGAGERSLPDDGAFSNAAAVFAGFGMEEAVTAHLQSSFHRAAAVARMRADLGITR